MIQYSDFWVFLAAGVKMYQFPIILLALLCSASIPAVAQNTTEEVLPTFGDVINILGAVSQDLIPSPPPQSSSMAINVLQMERTDQDFKDGLALDLFSPKNRTLTVQQNTKPLDAKFTTGSTGEGFVALMNYSYIIQMNETANDLIAKIEIPYELDTLNQMQVQEGNTYVGTLAADKMSWVIDETTRNVHRSENNTRIIKMTALDGEYMLLGRQSVDDTNIFVQYGQGATRTVNITGGGRQEAEFVDGLRFSVVAPSDLTMNVDLTNGIAPEALPTGAKSLNSFAWTVNTSNPETATNSTVRIPGMTDQFTAAYHLVLGPPLT